MMIMTPPGPWLTGNVFDVIYACGEPVKMCAAKRQSGCVFRATTRTIHSGWSERSEPYVTIIVPVVHM